MNPLDQLKQEIEALMSENEVVKANAMSVTIIKSSDYARRVYNNAKAENLAYQNVLELIDKIQKSEK